MKHTQSTEYLASLNISTADISDLVDVYNGMEDASDALCSSDAPDALRRLRTLEIAILSIIEQRPEVVDVARRWMR